MSAASVGEYGERGFVFRPSLLSAAEVRVLNDELERILRAGPAEDRVIREKDGRTVRTVVNPHLHSDVYARLVRHPLLLEAAEALLGDKVYVFQMGINCKAAFSGDVWFWHQDYPAYRQDDHIPRPRMVNTLIFLDEVTHLNSPLMLVPGSHKLTSDLPEASDKGTSYSFRYTGNEVIEDQVRAAGIVAPTGPAGSVIFMHVNTLHGSTANLSPWSRRLVTLTYNAISNKATSPSVRPRHIVYDDSALAPLSALGPDCLVEMALQSAGSR